MNILIWIIFGALVGWVASMIMRSRRSGLIRNIIVGLIGAFLGGWLGSFVGIGSVQTFTIEGFLTALAGAVVLILVTRIIF